mgnify:CR=1 FL=1
MQRELNGLTSARHDIFSKYISKKYPESYDPEISDNLVYSGSKKLTDKIYNQNVHVCSGNDFSSCEYNICFHTSSFSGLQPLHKNIQKTNMFFCVSISVFLLSSMFY